MLVVRDINRVPLDDSAQEFMKRVDAVDEVTPVHYLWLEKHPEDRHANIDELHDEIEAAFFTTPFTLTSKSGTMRAIAKENEALLSRADYRFPTLSDYSNPLWPGLMYNFIAGRLAVVLQVTRLPLTLILTAVLLLKFLWAPTLGDFFTIPTTFLLLLQLYQIFILARTDYMFARNWGWESNAKSGLYVNKKDTLVNNIVSKCTTLHTYPTAPFGLANGDWATIYPVLMYDDTPTPITQRYVERWVKIDDGEAILLHVCFPLNNDTGKLFFDPTKPVAVFHHGLSGSSSASYVLGALELFTAQGMTCIAMNSRGNGGSFVQTFGFNGVRTADIEAVVKFAHIGAGNCVAKDLVSRTRREKYSTLREEPQLATFSTVFLPDQNPMDMRLDYTTIRKHLVPILYSGFSMGGICGSNYVTTKGRYAGISSIVACCAMGSPVYNPQAVRDWEGALVSDVKAQLQKSEAMLHHGGLGGQPLNIPRLVLSNDLRGLDAEYSSRVSGFHGNPDDYYRAFSFFLYGKVHRLFCPMLVVHSADDPVLHADILEKPIAALNNAECDNLAILLTKTGGHIGLFQSYTDQWASLSKILLEFHTNTLAACDAAGKTHDCSAAADAPFCSYQMIHQTDGNHNKKNPHNIVINHVSTACSNTCTDVPQPAVVQSERKKLD